MEFKPRVVKTPKIIVKIEMEFEDSTRELDDCIYRVQQAIEFEHGGDHFSGLVVFLMRVLGASTWSLKEVSVDAPEKI